MSFHDRIEENGERPFVLQHRHFSPHTSLLVLMFGGGGPFRPSSSIVAWFLASKEMSVGIRYARIRMILFILLTTLLQLHINTMTTVPFPPTRETSIRARFSALGFFSGWLHVIEGAGM